MVEFQVGIEGNVNIDGENHGVCCPKCSSREDGQTCQEDVEDDQISSICMPLHSVLCSPDLVLGMFPYVFPRPRMLTSPQQITRYCNSCDCMDLGGGRHASSMPAYLSFVYCV